MNGRGITKRIWFEAYSLEAHSAVLLLFTPLISKQGNARQGNDKKDFIEKHSSAVHSPAFIPLTIIPLSISHV
jgi:hypothetical protein